jgi:F1F0 ATPase subunit 2
MPLSLWLLMSFAAGIVLGVIHFKGLWVTLRRLPGLRRPFRALIGSFLVRTSLVMSGFYLVMNEGMEQLAAALAGFILAREILRHHREGDTPSP